MTGPVGGNNPIPKLNPLGNRPLGKPEAVEGTPRPATAPGVTPSTDEVAGGVAGLTGQGPQGLGTFNFNAPNVAAEKARTDANANTTKEASAKAFQDAMAQSPPNLDAAAKAATGMLTAGGNAAQSYQQLMNQVPEAQRPALAQKMLGELAKNPLANGAVPRDVVGDLARAAVSQPGINARGLTQIQQNVQDIQRAQDLFKNSVLSPF